MKLIQAKCPACGAVLKIEEGLDSFYCNYCGSKIILEGQSDAAYYSKMKMKQFESETRQQMNHFQHAETEQKKKYEHREKMTNLVTKFLTVSNIVYYAFIVVLVLIALGAVAYFFH